MYIQYLTKVREHFYDPPSWTCIEKKQLFQLCGNIELLRTLNSEKIMEKIQIDLKGQCHENFVLTETVGF